MAEQNKTGMNDDVRQADESGEPGRAGRSHGRVVDKNNPEGASRPAQDEGSAPSEATEKSEHWESGRQRSN